MYNSDNNKKYSGEKVGMFDLADSLAKQLESLGGCGCNVLPLKS